MAGGARVRSGPPRKPHKLKVLEGTARADRGPGTLVSELPPGAPAEPSWPSLLPGRSAAARREAKAAWLRIVPELDRVGLLAHVDRDVLVDYCICWARLVECERALSREGPILEQRISRKDGSTYVQHIRNPLQLTANEYRAAISRYRPTLGLDPASRERLNVPAGQSGAIDGDEAAVFGS